MGKGECYNEIKEIAKNETNIKIHGYVENGLKKK